MDYVKELAEQKQILIYLGIFLCTAAYLFLKRPRRILPPGPRCLPIVGYAPFLGKDPHLTLYQLSKKYGDVFGLKLGSTYVVVITDLSTAKEVFNNPSAAKRSPHVFHMMPDGVGLASVNGTEWTEQRRFTVMQMKNLGFGKSSWEKMVQNEVHNLLDFIAQSNGHPVDIYPQLSEGISMNVLSLATGRPIPEGDILERGIESFMVVHNQSGLFSFYPRLYKFIAKLGLMKLRENVKEMVNMNKYIRSTIEELKQEEGESYIHTYLKEIDKSGSSGLRGGFNESNLIGNVQALIIGGSDTTRVSIQWLLLAMAAFPHIQDKVHQELDSVLGKECPPEWADRQRLPYCHATILEVQRWRTIAPLNVMHSTTEDTMVGQYVIPKDSDIIALIWAFHNDPRYWEDPEAFRPERFLTEDGKLVKKLGNYAPFSVGKRVCIGENVAHIEMFLYFAGLLQKFRILPESDDTSPSLEGISSLVFKPHRQQLRFLQR